MFADFFETLAIENRPHLIGELAERFGVTLRTLRFWEEKGLIRPQRERDRARSYSAEDVARIAYVVDARRVGFSVDEIRDLIEARDRLPPEAFRLHFRAALLARHGALEVEIAERLAQKEATNRWLALLGEA